MEERPTPPEPAPDAPERALADLRGRLDALAEAAAAFAHDLKNPLSALLLGVQRLARLADPARQAQARELASRLERSIQATSRLVDANVDLARLQAGQLEMERSRLPCAAVLVRAIEPLRPAAAQRGQELAVDLAPDLPEVEWDGDRVAEALEQILATALRLAPEGARVECTATVEGPVVAISVMVEVPPSPPPDPPIPVPSAPARRIRGSGLIVARSLVEAHGGSVDVEDGPERTTVRLLLPVHAAAAPSP